MLACICDNYAVVECLLLRGHKIDLPHRTDCLCSSCGKIAHSFSGRHQRLDTYRSLSSEAYLWLATRDPLLSAINLAEDLMVCQSYDTEHAEIYGQLLLKLQNFSSDFIQQCRNAEEVDCILNQREGASLSECDSVFPRVRLALDANLKPLLSHMNVQNSLRARWLGTWAEGHGNLLRDTNRFIRHTFGYPVLALLHSFSGGILVKSFEVPYARYLSYTTSYLLFIFLIAVLRYLKTNAIGEIFQNIIGSYVFLFVMGQILSEFLEFSRRGIKKYFGLCFDFILLYVFVVSFICWSGTKISPVPDGLPRKHWIAYDPAILFDVSFGTACLMSFLRVFYFIQLHRTLGSTVISIGRCVGQVFSYFGIMAIVIASFGLGISTLLQPYDHAVVLQSDGQTKEMASSFANELLVAVYYIVTVITLLNLMISLLVKKADEVLANEDVEWKFTRAHMYFEFFEDSAAVPPPFNLIYIFTSYLRKICSGKYTFVWPDLLTTKKLVEESKKFDSKKDYLKLLVTIFHRYQATKFNHYRTIQNFDADRKSKKEARAFMTFLNGRKPPPRDVPYFKAFC
uniref:Transient receptor ion channel domain-containing protein n=1 Tax=Panagrolaimus davidi TaxID=227884 RepID=A0A914P8X7_9BILA